MNIGMNHGDTYRGAGFPRGLVVKNLSAMEEMKVRSLGQEDPLQGEMATPPVFLLEDPMDRGARWAAVHRVTKSQTQLKRPCMIRRCALPK